MRLVLNGRVQFLASLTFGGCGHQSIVGEVGDSPSVVVPDQASSCSSSRHLRWRSHLILLSALKSWPGKFRLRRTKAKRSEKNYEIDREVQRGVS